MAGLWGEAQPSSPLWRRDQRFPAPCKEKEGPQCLSGMSIVKSPWVPGAWDHCGKKSRALDVHALKSRMARECRDWYPLQARKLKSGGPLQEPTQQGLNNLVQREREEDEKACVALEGQSHPSRLCGSMRKCTKVSSRREPKACPAC